MNKNFGKISSIITGLSVLAFSLSMILGFFFDTLFISCFASIFIAIGFIGFMISIYSVNDDENKKAIGLTGIAFGVIYATIVFIVYYAECTTIRLNPNLSEEALSIISYGKVGSLFFNYDLLGYGFMALSTFLISFIIKDTSLKSNKAFKYMLAIHGIFFITCLIMPMFPIFTAGTSDVFGVIVLEVWCLYFLPICILGYKYFCKEISDK